MKQQVWKMNEWINELINEWMNNISNSDRGLLFGGQLETDISLMFPIALYTVTSKMKRWGKSLTKAPLLMPSVCAKGASVRDCVCLVCLPETLRLQCPQMAQRGQCIRLLGPSSLLSPSSDLLQDKEALIKQCVHEQNVRRRDCSDSDPDYLSGGEPRTAKRSPTAQHTRPGGWGRKWFQRRKLTGWKREPSNRMRRRAVALLHSDREKCSLVLLCIVPLEGKWDAALTARCSRW